MKTDIAIAILAAIQICIESLPISSSTHEQLAVTILKKIGTDLPLWYNDKGFEFLLHIPTLIILTFFWTPRFIDAFVTTSIKQIIQIGIYIGISTGITVLAFPCMKYGGFSIPIWVGLLITAYCLYVTRYYDSPSKTITYRDAIYIGIVQAIALLPGVSRMASTLFIALWCGFSRSQAWWYSCALQLPLYGGAGLYGLYWAYMNPGYVSNIAGYSMIFSLIGGYSLLWLSEYLIQTNKVWYLSFYVAALSVYFFFIS